MRLILFFITLIFISCSDQHHSVDERMDPSRMMSDVAMLASDSFMGRKPFTQGEQLTVDYLSKSFAAAGALPGNGDSYIQQVPMVEITPFADTIMQVRSGTGKFSLTAPEEYVLWTNKTDPKISLANTPVVFAGYGVVAPEYGWNDYADIDVKGKVVLVMVNDPGFWNGDTTLFKGRTMTYYGRWTYKFEEAARQGAKACLVIHRTSAAGYPFRVVQTDFNSSRMQLEQGKNTDPECDMIGWITDTAATRLLKASGYTDDLFHKANSKNFRAVALNANVSTSMSVTSRSNVSSNVIAKIPGSSRPEEVIIYTAHWDHLGINEPDETGDSIYNGALDNATGVAGLLELSRAFSKLQPKPERSIVLLAVTAEEQGLLGSKYYTQNPLYPPDKTVADINIDVMNTYGITNDMVVVGLGQSELEDYLREAAESRGGYIVGEVSPETGGYFRSDHFNFAKIGIPALYAGSGIDIKGIGKDSGQKIKTEFTAKNYHQPSDEINPDTWKMEAAAYDLQLLFEVGKKLAFEKRWPEWKKGSEFKR